MKFSRYLFKLFITFISLNDILSHSFNHCSETTKFGIKQLNLVPDPPEIGSNLTISFSGTSEENVYQGSYLDIEISVLSIKIATHTYNLCNDLHVKCPIYQGAVYQGNLTYTIPKEVPKDLTISAKLNVYNSNKTEISCIELKTKLKTQLNSINDSNFYKINKNRGEIDNFRESEILFNYWINQYNWKFTSLLEYIERLYQFHDNNVMIKNHNKQTNNTFILGHNQFSHLSNQEFRNLMLVPIKNNNPNFITNLNYHCLTTNANNNNNNNNSIDWRTMGAITPVKNQGNCGSCWSFSTTGAMEGAYYLKTGNLTSFSEQQLVSCDKIDQGCNGGEMNSAFNWIHNNSGICSDTSYPYLSGDGSSPTCHKCKPINDTKVTSIVEVNQTEDSLKTALNKQPVAVAIEADSINFQFYKEGVLTGHCGTNLDHGVLAVGYGTDINTDYWLVKNSWSDKWGDNGYIKLARGLNQTGDQCGILLSASYPVL